MKQLFYALALVTLFFVAESAAQTPKAGDAACSLKFDEGTTYFESNQSGLTGDTSFLVLNTQSDFDKVFGSAYFKGKTALPANAFTSKFVVATIKRGNLLRTYALKKVTSYEGKLYVWYDTTDKPVPSATFNSPLIVAVDRADYSKVIFMENGEQAGTAIIKK